MLAGRWLAGVIATTTTTITTTTSTTTTTTTRETPPTQVDCAVLCGARACVAARTLSVGTGE